MDSRLRGNDATVSSRRLQFRFFHTLLRGNDARSLTWALLPIGPALMDRGQDRGRCARRDTLFLVVHSCAFIPWVAMQESRRFCDKLTYRYSARNVFERPKHSKNNASRAGERCAHRQGAPRQARARAGGMPAAGPDRVCRIRARAVPPAMRVGQAPGVGAQKQAEARSPVRGARRSWQRRGDQADHATPQSAGLPGRRADRAHRARAHAMVLPALRRAPAGRRRDRALRPQLVQPRRRRARHGLLLGRGISRNSSRPCPSSSACWSRSGIILVKYWFSITDEEQLCRFRSASTTRSSSGS